ncbi:MAG TPA: alpha/beta hydrolase, partial [Methylomirabilota bacterium]
IRVPTLFVHGTTDPFGTPDEVATIRVLIPAPTSVLQVTGGHDLGWGRRRDAKLPERIAAAFLDLISGR